MSERNDVAGPVNPSTLPPPPVRNSGEHAAPANVAQGTPSPIRPGDEAARARITALEREAKALGNDPAAAALFHEIGLIWEEALRNPRNAAVAFQNAYRLDPKLVSNIRAARRLFSDVGNWQMVLQLLDAEAAASLDDRHKAALLFEKASILDERLSRKDEASLTFKDALGLHPKDVSLLVQLASVFSARDEFDALVQVYRSLASVLEDNALRSHYLTLAGLVLEERLKSPEQAAQCFRQAFAMDRRDLVLLASVKRTAEREGRNEDVIEALAAEAQLLGEESAPAYLQLAKLYMRLSRHEDALTALLAARRAHPTDPLVLSALAGIYESNARHEDLADVLLAWAGAVSDESELVALNLRLASLYEENLKRDEDAIARYRAILARVPGHAPALAGLGKLYYRRSDWQGSLGVLEAEVAAAEDPKQRAVKLYKTAELLEERLKREEDAIARYNACLQASPGYLPAQKALTRLYERQHRYGELAAMYEQDLIQTKDRDQIIATLNRIAAIYEDRLSDAEHAIDAYKRILDVAPDHLPTLRNLARLYEQKGLWKDLIALLELEAGLVGDTKQVLSLHHRAAEVYEEEMKDVSGAISAYERVLAVSPSYLPALKALGRLYAREGRWEDLLRMYRAEAEISPSTAQAATLIAKGGELLEQKLNRENEAIAAYQEVLTLEPSYVPALRALGRIYRAQGAWENLVDVLRSEAANRTDPLERANALFEASSIWEEQLHRPELAISGYQEVLRLTSHHASALRALERLYTAQDNTKELLAVLDRETQTAPSSHAKVVAYLKLARLYLDYQVEPVRAAQCCEAALALEPGNLLGLTTLERVRAGDRSRRAELKARFAEQIADVRLKSALRLSAALDQETMAPETRIAEYRRALRDDPTDGRVAFALERALRQAQDHAGLAGLFEERLPASKPPEEQELALRLADLYEGPLKEPEKAARYYRLSLELRPGFIPAVQGLRRASLALNDFPSAREALEMEGQISRDAKTSVDAFVAAGRLCLDKLNDGDGAANNFRKALERDPLSKEANEGLENILAKRGGAEDLAGLHERRAEVKTAHRETALAAVEYFKAAQTWLSDVRDEARAEAALDRALAADPSHAASLELKGELSLKHQRYADAAAAFATRVQQGGDVGLLSELHLKLGSLYHDQLGDSSRAAAHLQTALSGDPRNLDALERLAAIHTTARNWTGAVDCLKRLLEVEQPPDAIARHQIALGRIYDQGFNDPSQASALYRKALDLNPADEGIANLLVEVYERSGNQPELVNMLEHQAGRVKDNDRVIFLLVKAAELAARSLGDAPRAIALYRRVADLDPSSIVAHTALADLLMRDPTQVNKAIDEHRTVLRLDASRVESLHALFRLWESQRQSDRAFLAASLLQALESANEMELGFYNELKGKLPQDSRGPITADDLNRLIPKDADNALSEILRVVGDQLGKIYSPNFEALGVDRKADRLKPDHPIHKAMRAAAELLGVEEIEVYQARRGLITVEMGEPPAVCVGPDLVLKFNLRDLKFLIGRAVMGLRNKTALVQKLSRADLTDLLGNCVRIHVPTYAGLGRRNDEAVKQLKKVLPRKALKALERPAQMLAGMAAAPSVDATVAALEVGANRLGLLMSGDPAAAIGMVMRDDVGGANVTRVEGQDAASNLLRRPEAHGILQFVLSEEFAALRRTVGPSVPVKAPAGSEG